MPPLPRYIHPQMYLLNSLPTFSILHLLRIQLLLMRLRLRLPNNRHLIQILPLTQLDHLSQTRLTRKQEINLLQRLARRFRVKEVNDNDSSPVEDAKDNVEFPADILDADGRDFDDEEGDEPLPDHR